MTRLIILITLLCLIAAYWHFRKKLCEVIKIDKAIADLLFITIIMPIIIWMCKYWVDGEIVFQRPYESGWFSFFGSYLGGLLGGVATLIAVVRTIENNKEEYRTSREEQAEKENAEKQKETQESALIM